MSSNRKIHNRLNKLFDEIKETGQPETQPEKTGKQRTPASSSELPQQPYHTGTLSPATQ
jgi:hypothetical protein